MNMLISTTPLTVYEHMALDEYLVSVRPQAVTLRFYHWTPGPAVTFGYAQGIREVEQALATASFAGAYTRRPTGGGLVFHTDDLTFSLIFPSHDKPAAIYRQLHAAIFAALKTAGVGGQLFQDVLPASAYAPSVNQQASACFVRPVENDLLAQDGQKMLGGAIRRFGATVLYQGSLQLPGARLNPAFKRSIIEAVRQFLVVDLRAQACSPEGLQRARQLAQHQYESLAWREKF